jgi:hypothetical protein
MPRGDQIADSFLGFVNYLMSIAYIVLLLAFGPSRLYAVPHILGCVSLLGSVVSLYVFFTQTAPGSKGTEKKTENEPWHKPLEPIRCGSCGYRDFKASFKDNRCPKCGSLESDQSAK